MVDHNDSESHFMPLVWGAESWARQLASQDTWPDLRSCVELYFMSNPAMRNYTGVREHPIPFEYSESFLRSVETTRDAQLQQALIKALAKKVYGVLDSGLHDEPFGEMDVLE